MEFTGPKCFKCRDGKYGLENAVPACVGGKCKTGKSVVINAGVDNAVLLHIFRFCRFDFLLHFQSLSPYGQWTFCQVPGLVPLGP